MNDDAKSATARALSPAAVRALEEARARRAAADGAGPDADREADPETGARRSIRPSEKGGQPGPDPVRYGDWEKGGIASDF